MGESSLTAGARRSSALIATLDDTERVRVGEIVGAVVRGGRGMGSLPEAIASELEGVLMGFIFKSRVFGAEPLWKLIKAGCSPEVLALIGDE